SAKGSGSRSDTASRRRRTLGGARSIRVCVRVRRSRYRRDRGSGAGGHDSRKSQVASRESQVASRKSQVASRKSQVASRKSQVASPKFASRQVARRRESQVSGRAPLSFALGRRRRAPMFPVGCLEVIDEAAQHLAYLLV